MQHSLSLRSELRGYRKRFTRFIDRFNRRLKRPDVYSTGSAERVGVVFDNPSEMSTTERLLLYALVRGLQPQLVLEIGSRRGGSAAIIAAALKDTNFNTTAKIIGLDPYPEIEVPKAQLYGLFELVQQPSPEGLADAAKAGGNQPFDFVLVDGLHIYSQVLKDVSGILPHLRDGGHILLHDAFHIGVAKAIEEMIQSNPSLHDCGYLASKPSINGIMAYGGFRLLRYAPGAVVDPQTLVQRETARTGKAPPLVDLDLLDHDPHWYCRKMSPCAYCRKHGLNMAPANQAALAKV